MMPVAGSSTSPAGRLPAEKVKGPWPVAGTRKRKGRPGVAPVMRGLWIAGCGEFSRAKGGTAAGNLTAAGLAVAPGDSSSLAPAQSA